MKESYKQLQVMFTEYARFPQRWSNVEKKLFQDMKNGTSAVRVYLVVVINRNIEVWSWPNELEVREQIGAHRKKRMKIESGEVRRCIVSSFNEWDDVWSEVETGVCLRIRKRHFTDHPEMSKKMAMEDIQMADVVAMDANDQVNDQDKRVEGKVYVLQIVDRNSPVAGSFSVFDIMDDGNSSRLDLSSVASMWESFLATENDSVDITSIYDMGETYNNVVEAFS
eukprot:g5208.t1